MEHLDVPAILRDAGLNVQTVPGWETRAQPGAFAPIGSILHDTVGAGPSRGDAPSLNYIVTRGLSQFVVGYSGTVYVCSVARQWHAGNGYQNVRFAAQEGASIPVGEGTSENANMHWWGWEVENRGAGSGERWTDAQRDAVLRGHVALCDAKNYHRSAVVGHYESAGPRKVDPWSVDCKRFRADAVRTQYGQEDDDVRQILVSVAGDPGPVYITDGLHRRHLTSAALPLVTEQLADPQVHAWPLDEVLALKLVGATHAKTHRG